MYKALKEAQKQIAYEERLNCQCITRPKPTEKWAKQTSSPL
jgi:hypothetical protein